MKLGQDSNPLRNYYCYIKLRAEYFNQERERCLLHSLCFLVLGQKQSLFRGINVYPCHQLGGLLPGMISSLWRFLIQVKYIFQVTLMIYMAVYRKQSEKVSATPDWNTFKEFSNYLLLMQPTMSALHFVIDFFLFKLMYEAPKGK